MLYTRMMEPAEVLTYTPSHDAEGNIVEALTGAKRIKAAFTFTPNGESAVADAKEPLTACRLTTFKAQAPAFHAVIRRVKDGGLWRVVSEPTESPAVAGFDLANVTLERWHG